MDDSQVQTWINLIMQGRKCKNQIEKVNFCKDAILSLDFRSIVQSDYTDFDGMRAELEKGSYPIQSLKFFKLCFLIFSGLLERDIRPIL